MRKIVAIILLSLYIVSATGVAVRAHYSGGKLKSIDLVLNSKESKCGNKNCCFDKLAFYKVDDSENSTTDITFSPSFDKIFYQVSYIVKSCFEPYSNNCTSGLVC